VSVTGNGCPQKIPDHVLDFSVTNFFSVLLMEILILLDFDITQRDYHVCYQFEEIITRRDIRYACKQLIFIKFVHWF